MKEERQQKILDLLEKRGFCSVSELSHELFVSMPTVRRDLAEMNRLGLIVRNHGGARKAENGFFRIPLDFRSSFKTNEKKQLCRAAAEVVSENSVIFIDASTTLAQLPLFLPKSVTVITNSLLTAMLLCRHGFPTYISAGRLIESSLAVGDGYLDPLLDDFVIDTAFFSAYGVNAEGDIIDTSPEEVGVRKKMLRRARKSVFVFDHEKYPLNAPYRIAPLSDIDLVITNAPLPDTLGAGNITVV